MLREAANEIRVNGVSKLGDIVILCAFTSRDKYPPILVNRRCY